MLTMYTDIIDYLHLDLLDHACILTLRGIMSHRNVHCRASLCRLLLCRAVF